MKRPKVHNQRFASQAAIIAKHVDFTNKVVTDFGCGYGDMLFFAAMQGAQKIIGVETGLDVLPSLENRITYSETDNITIIKKDINQIVKHQFFWYSDIAICFAVLPYLENPKEMLRHMYQMCEISLIECQYAGDGPGLSEYVDDDYFQHLLWNTGWKWVQPIGKTFVHGRNKWRTIWYCERSLS